VSILNYTTQIAPEKTAMEITAMLVRKKAQAIMSEYEDGIMTAISFRIVTPAGVMSFRLPANVQRIYQVIIRDKEIQARLKTREQAARTAWRIVKVWLEAQMAIIEADMVDFEQVFLPYAQNAEGVTLYESLKERQFESLAFRATTTLDDVR